MRKQIQITLQSKEVLRDLKKIEQSYSIKFGFNLNLSQALTCLITEKLKVLNNNG